MTERQKFDNLMISLQSAVEHNSVCCLRLKSSTCVLVIALICVCWIYFDISYAHIALLSQFFQSFSVLTPRFNLTFWPCRTCVKPHRSWINCQLLLPIVVSIKLLRKQRSQGGEFCVWSQLNSVAVLVALECDIVYLVNPGEWCGWI